MRRASSPMRTPPSKRSRGCVWRSWSASPSPSSSQAPPASAACCRSFVRDGEISDQELQIHHEDGSSQWLSLSVRPLTRAGEPSGQCDLPRGRDPERMRLRAMEEQNAGLESYVHGVSHDLRSPLVSLLGFTRLLSQDYSGPFSTPRAITSSIASSRPARRWRC